MPALRPWPKFNQLKDWTTDVDQSDENAENNCGPESVAMCLKYLTGVELPADFIKDVMYSPTYTGYSFDDKLSEFMEKRCAIPVKVHSGDARTRLQPIVEGAIDAGFPIIVLYFWEIKKPESGHWAPVIAYDEEGCTRLNPWGGAAETWSWAKFEAWQKLGLCIVLQRARDPNLGSRDLETEPLAMQLHALLHEAADANYALPPQEGEDVLRD